jgi:hypothetical protein
MTTFTTIALFIVGIIIFLIIFHDAFLLWGGDGKNEPTIASRIRKRLDETVPSRFQEQWDKTIPSRLREQLDEPIIPRVWHSLTRAVQKYRTRK